MRLLAECHRVIGIARDFSKVPSEQAGFQPAVMDLADLDGLPERLQTLSRRYPGLDGLVCNAGTGRFGSLEEFSYAQIRSLVDLNFVSTAFLARTFLPIMKRKGRGDLIFIGSDAALSGGRKGAIYAASKFAVRGLAQSLRQECATSGVRVALVNPGMVKTPFYQETHFTHGAAQENYVLPEDVAEAVLLILTARPETVFDEINLSPLKKVIRWK